MVCLRGPERGLGGVSQGLKTTFQYLARTENEAAVRLLLHALDSPYPGIREAALRAILTRRSPAGHREVLRRLDTMDERWRQIIGEFPGRMLPTLREAVSSGDARLCATACRAAVWYREYDLIPALINALENPVGPGSDLAGRTLAELVDALCGELAAGQPGRARPDPQTMRQRAIDSLESSVKRYLKHRRREIVEAFVRLVGRDNVTLRQILEDPHHAAFVAVVDVLSKSEQGSVIWLLLSFLDDPHAPSAALSVISKRGDARFVQALLRKASRETSESAAQNLKRIESLTWLKGGDQLLEQLDETSQQAVVRLLMASSVPKAQSFGTIRHLLLGGKLAGRRAAAEALGAFPGAEANDLALHALDDEDPQVQAHLGGQLRRRGIPGALLLLVQMLDSPHAVVRTAARDSLDEFSFRRFLGAFDMLDDEVRRSTGALVRKVDPHTIPLLKAEMESKVCRRRLRALAMADAMGALAELEGAIVGLLEDEDHLVRAEAATVLGRCPSATARQALHAALTDRSQTVREAARRSLEAQAAGTVEPKALLDSRGQGGASA